MARSRKSKGAIINGILLLDKPLHISSNRALQRARAIFNAKKAGHTGSLDPLATGVLPLCFGEATKVSSFLLDSNKRYTTTAQLGFVSTTGDGEGDMINERPIPSLTEADIKAVLERFTGDIQQIPPMHSALKHNGKPLYELARQGIEIEREARHVTIYALELLDYTETTLILDVQCSKGTYIRTLVEDIGEALNCGAYVSQLKRTEVEPFQQGKLYALEELEQLRDQGLLESTLLPVDTALVHWPMLSLNAEQSLKLFHGQRVHLDNYKDLASGVNYRLYNDKQTFVGIGQIEPSGLLASKRRFDL